MRFWLAANAFLLAISVSTVGLVCLTTALIFRLELTPLNERIACSAAALAVVIVVGLTFRRMLARFQRQPAPKT